MALLEESGKQGVCFYYPIGRAGSDNLRSVPILTYQKVGVYFASLSAALLAFGIILLAFIPKSDNGFTLFAGCVLVYGAIRLTVLFPKMNISAQKIKKASPGPFYALIDQCCYFLAGATMEWLFYFQLPPSQSRWLVPIFFIFIGSAILPLINSAILLRGRR